MVPLNVIDGPRFKIERGNSHIREIERLSNPLSPELHTVRVEKRRERSGFSLAHPHFGPLSYDLMYRSLKPIAPTFALAIGDAVHNFRGALDHLATGIVRSVQDWKHKENHFPMRRRREDLLIGGGEPIQDLAALEVALPGSTELLLDKIRPRNGREEPCWSFHVLDNDDKHNLIIPTVTVSEVRVQKVKIDGNIVLERSGSIFNAEQPNGWSISKTVGLAMVVEGEIATHVDLKFGADTPFAGESVTEILWKISDIVSKAVDHFECLVKSKL